LRLEELKPSEKKLQVLNTVKEQQMVHVLGFCSIPDVKEYNIYGDEDLFLHEAFLDIIFRFHYNRRIVHYQILENIIGFSLWRRLALIYRKS
jgi:hypothetical protein